MENLRGALPYFAVGLYLGLLLAFTLTAGCTLHEPPSRGQQIVDQARGAGALGPGVLP